VTKAKFKTALLTNLSKPLPIDVELRVCDSFFSKLKGLMFTPTIEAYQGLLFIETYESRMNTGIHMFFMNFDIACIWLDKEFKVVDLVYAKKWKTIKIPEKPAQYTLELNKDLLPYFSINDQLRCDYA